MFWKVLCHIAILKPFVWTSKTDILSQDGSIFCIHLCLQAIDSLDSSLVRHLLTPWLPAWKIKRIGSYTCTHASKQFFSILKSYLLRPCRPPGTSGTCSKDTWTRLPSSCCRIFYPCTWASSYCPCIFGKTPANREERKVLVNFAIRINLLTFVTEVSLMFQTFLASMCIYVYQYKAS